MPYGNFTANEVISEALAITIGRTAKSVESNIKINRVHEVESLMKKLTVQVSVLTDFSKDLRS